MTWNYDYMYMKKMTLSSLSILNMTELAETAQVPHGFDIHGV